MRDNSWLCWHQLKVRPIKNPPQRFMKRKETGFQVLIGLEDYFFLASPFLRAATMPRPVVRSTIRADLPRRSRR